MINKDKIEVLKQYRSLQIKQFRIVELKYCIANNRYLERLDLASNPGATISRLSDMPTSHCISNSIENNYIILETLEHTLKKLKNEIRKAKLKVLAIINTIQFSNRIFTKIYRTIMRLRYIQGYKWQTIADKVNYTSEHTRWIHSRALARLKI